MFDRNLLQDGSRFARWITAYEEWDKIITLSKSWPGYQLSTVSKTLNDAQIPDHKLNPATVSLWTHAEMLEWKRIAVMLLLYRLKMSLITLSLTHQEEKPTSLFLLRLTLTSQWVLGNESEWYRLHNHLRRFLHFLNSAADKESLVTQHCGITGLPDS